MASDEDRPSLGGRATIRNRSRDRKRSRSRSRGRYDRPRQRRSRSVSPRRHRRSRSRSRDQSPDRRCRSPPALEETPAVGTIHHGRIVSARPFGVFVDLPGFRKQGLIHHTQVSEEVHFGRDDDEETRVKALEYFCPRGEEVYVKIIEVRGDGRDARVGCSMRAVDQSTGTDLDPDNLLRGSGGGGGGGGEGGRPSDTPPELYSIHSGVVQSVKPFGVFVQLDGFRKYGLVHTSQISDHLSFTAADSDAEKIAGISEVVDVGERVWVKVVDVTEDERGPKVACSIKLVSQREGTDLDPQNVKYRPRGEGGGPGGQFGGRPVAAVAQTHDAVVEWGHLKADVVQYGGGRQYDILAASGDDSEGRAPPRAQAPGPSSRQPPPNAMPPRGRGMGNVLPAWMTGSGDAAPGSAPSRETAAGEAPIRTVEDALAVLEQYGAKRRKHKKHKHKKEKKSRKEKKSSKKSKKHRHRSRSRGSSSSSSGSDD